MASRINTSPNLAIHRADLEKIGGGGAGGCDQGSIVVIG
jgi:hypothetical protein